MLTFSTDEPEFMLICLIRSRVFLFLTPLGLPVRLEILYLHRTPSFSHPWHGNLPLHLILLWWQVSHAERRLFGLDDVVALVVPSADWLLIVGYNCM